MTIDEVEMVFRDQRELEGSEVHAIARVLRGRSAAKWRAGQARPIRRRLADIRSMRCSAPRGGEPEFVVTREVIAGLHERMDRLERLIELVIAKLDRR